MYEDDTGAYDWDMPDEEPDYDDESFFDDEFGEDFYDDLERMPDATDLLDPESFVYGTSEIELFANIADGTGPTMPGFREVLGEEEAIWDIVNYIRSLWGENYVD